MSEFAVSVQLKKLWKKSKSNKSLRQFVNELISTKSEYASLANQWYKNKDGSLNKNRLDTNIARAKIEKDATKAARRKKASKKDKEEV